MSLKEQKAALTKRYAVLTTRLAEIAEDIPKNLRQSAPMAPPTMDLEIEDPAINIKVLGNHLLCTLVLVDIAMMIH